MIKKINNPKNTYLYQILNYDLDQYAKQGKTFSIVSQENLKCDLNSFLKHYIMDNK